MQESGVTAKGQTTLPRSVRQALGVSPGDRLRYLVLDGGEVRILKLRPVSELGGMLKTDRSVSLDEMEAAIRASAGT
ncbi:AbrB/MazE/SpoVT family DNA-binding domain-containing protein [Palleronia sp.]|uniref:AbrB/MazE/SpoVT family DNA-binding domain-containing protein n=1 Tax=Palleronia sp. TaxID=1940284 RepID=UPI0035C83124